MDSLNPEGNSIARDAGRPEGIEWLYVFGPGAILASLTIGSGELIFSSRGGALFGYRLLWIFALICLVKWALVYGASRHMVLTGAHPFERWRDLPGPSGWLVVTFLMLGVAAFPVWVGFHAGTLGTLMMDWVGDQWLSSVRGHLIWGGGILILVGSLILLGGYERLEKLQISVVMVFILAVGVTLWVLHPGLAGLIQESLDWQGLRYPSWSLDLEGIRGRPLWVELTSYIGVIGGSGFDYLAYVAYLRRKKWGVGRMTHHSDLHPGSFALHHATAVEKQWLQRELRFPLWDGVVSFTVVFFISAAFLACGRLVLSPQEVIPQGTHLLTYQVQFLTQVHAVLKPLYFFGAFLALFGTLYGTIEVAPAVFEEAVRALRGKSDSEEEETSRRRRVVLTVWLGAMAVLIWLFLSSFVHPDGKPTLLMALLTPANLFTGVLACGIVCWSNLWMDARYLPSEWRMGWCLWAINGLGGGLFFGMGMKAYYDAWGWNSIAGLVGTLGLAITLRWAFLRWGRRGQK